MSDCSEASLLYDNHYTVYLWVRLGIVGISLEIVCSLLLLVCFVDLYGYVSVSVYMQICMGIFLCLCLCSRYIVWPLTDFVMLFLLFVFHTVLTFSLKALLII